jgi:hypothetical protein
MTSETATYVYCLVRGARAPRLDDAPAGLAGTGRPRVLDVGGGLRLVVADAPLERYAKQAIEQGLSDIEWVGARALEHEALVEHVLASGTVVPMKLFTLFLGVARAVADVRAREAELGALLDRLEGRREWGVRVLVDPTPAAEAARERAEAGEAADQPAGTAFLLRKKRVLDATRTLRTELLGRAHEALEALSALAAEVRSRPPLREEGRLLLDASFLVEDDATQAFHAQADERRDALAREGLALKLSGPWPAYNFVEPAR